jgi:signal transduction protein with GAF and PtsI domain
MSRFSVKMPDNLKKELADARRTIREQARELRKRQADIQFAEALREALVQTAAASAIAAPAAYNAVLEDIVKTAADVMLARAASLFVLDEENGELVFQVALGDKAEAVRQFRVPLGTGIAGYVAATGQPVAIANADEDPRFARNIGQAIGYIPRTILCVPLYLDGSVIGVLELLDKVGGAPFSSTDMELLARFANLAALALDQSRLICDTRLLFRTLLSDIVQAEGFKERLAAFADGAADYSAHSNTLILAKLVHDVGRHASGGQLALEVLTGIARFLEASRHGDTQ